jgi:5'-phosphate synthase pdxT subunit
MARTGVLALQGDFAAHAAVLDRLGSPPVEVRHTSQLDGLGGLVIPGGESTTLLNLMRDEPWFEALRRFRDGGAAILGTCAGAILLAREVVPGQRSLGFVDARIERNAYGRQVDSFEAELETAPPLREQIRALFIRAPRFAAPGPGVEILARHEGEPVLLRQGRVLAATFHPELSGDTALHELFLQTAVAASGRAASNTDER